MQPNPSSSIDRGAWLEESQPYTSHRLWSMARHVGRLWHKNEKLRRTGSQLLEGRREAVELETKRENPEGKIRGITIVGKEAIA